MIQDVSANSEPNRAVTSKLAGGFFVGDVAVASRLILAPMEDVTNLPFRILAKRIGNPGLMMTEFVSAMAVHYNPSATLKKMMVHDKERPVGIQIFGGDPQIMAETARKAEEEGADVIDINMGCWVPKVVKTGAGAALLKDPDLAEKIVDSVVRAVKVPVSVKVRAGWDYSLFAAPELAKRFQGVGAKMLTLHARFAKQGFEGEADWNLIAQMKKVLEIPVIGNGDVKSGEDAERMLLQTGCDAVMVGRAAIGNPWALRAISARLRGDSEPAPPTLSERINVALEHLSSMIAFSTLREEGRGAKSRWTKLDDAANLFELSAVKQLRGQLPLYIKGVPGAAAIRHRLTSCKSFCEVEDTLRAFEASLEGG